MLCRLFYTHLSLGLLISAQKASEFLHENPWFLNLPLNLQGILTPILNLPLCPFMSFYVLLFLFMVFYSRNPAQKGDNKPHGWQKESPANPYVVRICGV